MPDARSVRFAQALRDYLDAGGTVRAEIDRASGIVRYALEDAEVMAILTQQGYAPDAGLQ